jgi:hypothetical protein
MTFNLWMSEQLNSRLITHACRNYHPKKRKPCSCYHRYLKVESSDFIYNIRKLFAVGMYMKNKNEIVEMRYRLLLEALRRREEEVLRYLAILGPAFGGLFYLVTMSGRCPKDDNIWTFCVAIAGLEALLLLGAWYCSALGYNYRSIIIQVVKLEETLKVQDSVLNAWPKTIGKCAKRSQLGHYFQWLSEERHPKIYKLPWCFPPAIINVFLWAFCLSIVYFTLSTIIICGWYWQVEVATVFGVMFLFFSLYAPYYFGKKLKRVCDMEKQEDKQGHAPSDVVELGKLQTEPKS